MKKIYDIDTEEELDIEEEDHLKGDSEDDLFNEDLSFDNMGLGGLPSPMEKHADLLKDLTNFAPYLKETVNGWLGLIWDHSTGTYEKDPNGTPIMNAKCASWSVSFLKTYARNNNIITHIGKNEYIFLVDDIISVIWYNIGLREDFGIANSGDVLRICTELQHSAELVLMGAGDGKYNELLSTATQRNENVNFQRITEPNNPIGLSPNKQFQERAKAFLTGK